MDFLYVNSVFVVQLEGTYLPRIVMETFIDETHVTHSVFLDDYAQKTDTVMP